MLVWIHGGGFVQDSARNYDPKNLAAEGTVVVTVNYRLGAARVPGPSCPRLVSRRPVGQLRAHGPASRAALGAAQHPYLRWRPEQRDDRRRIGRGPVGPHAHGLEGLARPVPEGDRAERVVRHDPAAPQRGGGLRSVRRYYRWLRGSDRGVPAQQAGGRAGGELPAGGDPWCDRRSGPHRVDRNCARRGPVRPGPGPQRDEP